MAEFLFPLPADTVVAGVEKGLKEQDWARLAGIVGSDVGWSLSAGSPAAAVPGAHQTRVGPFFLQGGGFSVWAKSSATVSHRAQSSGSRYDFIGIRLDWTPDAAGGGGTAQLVLIEGSTSNVLPASRQTTLGTVFDVPVAQVLVTPTGVQVTPLHVSATKSHYVESLLAIPAPRMGMVAYVGNNGDRFRWDGSAWRDDAPSTRVYQSSINQMAESEVAKAPKMGRLLSQISIPDPGYPYSVLLTGQFELDPVTRTRVTPQYAASSTMTGAVVMKPQFYATRGFRETKSLTMQVIPARVGPTVINLLSDITDGDYVTGASYAVSPYNGFFQAVVLPR